MLIPATAKIFDTSVIIDGGIRGMLVCGLLEGKVIVAQREQISWAEKLLWRNRYLSFG